MMEINLMGICPRKTSGCLTFIKKRECFDEDETCYLIKACLEGDRLEEGYDVSPEFENKWEAYLFLIQIISDLKRF